MDIKLVKFINLDWVGGGWGREGTQKKLLYLCALSLGAYTFLNLSLYLHNKIEFSSLLFHSQTDLTEVVNQQLALCTVVHDDHQSDAAGNQFTQHHNTHSKIL